MNQSLDLDRFSPFAAMESMNMDETKELLPCPFCGPRQSHVALWFDNSAKRWRVGCGRCGCSTGTSPHEDGPQPAAARWNNRPKMLDDTMRTRFAQFVKDLRHHIDRYGLVKVDNSEVSFLESVGSTLSPASPPSSVGEEATDGWQDISTAPWTFGKPVLLWKANTKEHYVAARVSGANGPGWCTPDGFEIFHATHWQPLPKPPVTTTDPRSLLQEDAKR